MKKQNSTATKSRFSLFTGVLLAILIVYTAFLFILFLWAIITSFKSQADFRLNTYGFPDKLVWNYSFVLRQYKYPIQTDQGTAFVGMPMMFLYTLLYAGGCAFFATLTPCIVAYLCARFPFKFGKVINLIVIITMILPIVGALPSEIQVAKTLHIFDSIWGQWIMKANFLGMYFLVFYNVFKGIPKEFTEAAKIDGAGNMNILVRIMLPLVRNTFFVIMLIKFIEFWNDYQIPMIYLPSYPTIALGMYDMANSKSNELSTVPMKMTAAVLTLIPIMAVFLAFHNKLMGNLTIGGIKG